MSDRTGAQQTMEQLQQRYEQFKSQKVKFETQRDAALEELENLKQQARELYDSDDVSELEKMLERMKAENENKRSQYQASLDNIDRQLQEVESKFSDNASQEA